MSTTLTMPLESTIEREQEPIAPTGQTAHVAAALDRAALGRTTRIAICGADGPRRSEMVEAARSHAQNAAMRILATRGRRGDTKIDFAPMLTLLQPVSDRLDDLPHSEAAALKAAARLEADSVDRLAASVGLWRLLTQLSAEGPVLLAIDESDQMDAASLELLAFAVGRLDAQPVAVVTASDCHRSPNALVDVSDETIVLDRPDRETLIRSVEAHAPATDWVLAHMASFAGNDPAIATELVRSLSPDQRAGRTACPQVPRPPESFVTALRPIVDRLPSDAQRALVLIAADSTGDLDVIQEAARRMGHGESGLRRLEAEHYIEAVGTSVRVSRPMLEVVAYSTLSPSERREVHAALAEAMSAPQYRGRRAWQLAAAGDGPDSTVAAALASDAQDQQARGALRPSAVAWETAAEFAIDAVDRRNYQIAALGLWTGLGDYIAARAALDGLHDDSVEIRLARSAAVRWLDGDAAAVAELRAAAPNAGPAERALIDALYADAAFASGREREALEIARGVAGRRVGGHARNLAEAILVLGGGAAPEEMTPLVDPGADVDVVSTRAAIRHAQVHARYGALEPAQEALDQLGDVGHVAWDPAEHAATSARLTAASGQPAAARQMLLALIENLPEKATIANAVLGEALAECHFLLGDGEAAMAVLEDVVPVFGAVGMARYEASGRITVGRVAWSVGQTDLALSCLERARGLDGSASVGDLVALLSALGRDQDARAWLDRIDIRPTDPVAPIDLLRARAAVADTTAGFDSALAAAREANLVVAAAELLIDQAAWHHRRKQWSDVETVAAKAARLMIPSGITAWIDRLDQLEPPAEDPVDEVPAVLAELTDAERRVAMAVSRGLTNKEAAAELFVSVKTVDSHLQRVYPKLMIRSRSELAALVNSAAA